MQVVRRPASRETYGCAAVHEAYNQSPRLVDLEHSLNLDYFDLSVLIGISVSSLSTHLVVSLDVWLAPGR